MSHEIRKQATDVPIIDEIIYQCQKMIKDLVLKNEEEANKNETLLSIRESDMYKIIIEGKSKFEFFDYTYDLLTQVPSITKLKAVEFSRDNKLIPNELKPTLLTLAKEKFLNNYQEKNNYYRTLYGLPKLNDAGIVLNSEDISIINNDKFDYAKYVHQMTNDEINLLEVKGIIDRLKERYPNEKYLYHLGEKRIDPYKARKAPNFSVLYLPTCESMEVYRKFYEKLELNRVFILNTIYSDAYKFNSDYYDNFIMMMIIVQALDDMIITSPEYIINRELFDLRTIQFIFEASGVTFYKEIPLKYQKRLVKNLNRLIKFSSCEKNFIDIASLFGFENIELFKYYILKQPIMNKDGSYKHEVKIDPETGLDVEDKEKNYKLKFVKIPIDGLIDDYIRDERNHLSYEDITKDDIYWNGTYDPEYVKQRILNRDFNLRITKYMSIDTLYSLTKISFEMVYFINMILYSGLDMSSVTVPLPELNSNLEFELTDLFITLYSLSYIYNGIEDNIIYDKSIALDINGFNFSVDWDKLSKYIRDNDFTEKDLGIDKFTIPKNGILNFNQLIEVFLNNKNVYNHIVNQLKNASSKEMYDIYKKIYDSLMVTNLNYKFFREAGNGLLPKTYSDYIMNRDSFLYELIINCKRITKENDRKLEISRIINIIVDNIFIYLKNDDFRYIFQGIPTVSLDYIKEYMFLMLNFFKSYKVDLLNSNNVYHFDDSLENKLIILDSLKMKTCLHRKDFLGIEDYKKFRIYTTYRDRFNINDEVFITPYI